MRRALASAAFWIARLRAAGPVVRLGFAHGTRFLPVERLCETDAVLAFRHPSPSTPGHTLIVPKRAIRGVEDLTPRDGPLLVEILQVARLLAASSGAASYQMVVNAGAFQDIRQLHFHLILKG